MIRAEYMDGKVTLNEDMEEVESDSENEDDDLSATDWVPKCSKCKKWHFNKCLDDHTFDKTAKCTKCATGRGHKFQLAIDDSDNSDNEEGEFEVCVICKTPVDQEVIFYL
jgi:hypothetical protein